MTSLIRAYVEFFTPQVFAVQGRVKRSNPSPYDLIGKSPVRRGREPRVRVWRRAGAALPAGTPGGMAAGQARPRVNGDLGASPLLDTGSAGSALMLAPQAPLSACPCAPDTSE
ncbi:hypothetical protein GCM10023215_02330 [Pseudonocardia yuanmonensis]|uniref:Uncharacterized protein n=1 Tax=Pseudonocardia yuanmonensis TaxID=1095914 RepID=A0ABP8VWR3_9PSEU